jgi:hypothetical protein
VPTGKESHTWRVGVGITSASSKRREVKTESRGGFDFSLPALFLGARPVAKLDVEQINKNRKEMDDSTIESPYVDTFADSDCDIPQRLFDSNMPADNVGFMPPNERKRGKP